MLTLSLVCSFSPKVQKYLLGAPDLLLRAVIEQSNAATNPYFVNASFPAGTKVSRVGGGYGGDTY